jgi:hypothetical protein
MVKSISAALTTVGLAGALMVGATMAAEASTIVFSEDFSGATEGLAYNTGSSGGTGVIGGTQLKVTAGDVDIIGPANYTCAANAAIKCIDMIGGTGQGSVASTVGIDLHAGNTYTIDYTDVLQGFAAGPTPSLNYTVALGSHSFNTSSIPTVQLMSFSFVAAVNELGAILSFVTTQNLDNVHGPVLSGISVSETVAATPLPASLPLLASALGGLGFVGWRRKQAAH